MLTSQRKRSPFTNYTARRLENPTVKYKPPNFEEEAPHLYLVRTPIFLPADQSIDQEVQRPIQVGTILISRRTTDLYVWLRNIIFCDLIGRTQRLADQCPLQAIQRLKGARF